MDIEREREAFEKAFAQTEFYRNKADLYSLLADIDDETFDFFRKNGFGDYSIGEAQAAWSAWQAAKAQAVLKWISVKDNLPPANILVLGMSQTRSNIFNIYNVMDLDEFEEADVTHWMPLPDVPQEPAND